MEEPVFAVGMAVRDYECDLQGVVNNAVYQNYLEHARHEFLKDLGINFADVTAQGIHLVVTRAELDYRAPLVSGDRFTVSVYMERVSKLRFAFVQQIRTEPDGAVKLDARIIGTALNGRRRPFVFPALDAVVREVPHA